MNEENENFEDKNNDEWQAPPLPEEIKVVEKEQPQMSEIGTLLNIFIEPGKTFEDLRKKPRFIMAGLITVILIGVFSFAFQQKVGEERMRRFIVEQNEKNQQFTSASPEQQKQANDIGYTIAKISGYLIPVFLTIWFFVGGLFYWLGVKLMGGVATYLQSVSVWIYSTFVPTILSMFVNIIALIFKSPDDIDIATSSRGLIQVNPSFLINSKEMPVLSTLLSIPDLFFIWGVVLAGIGLSVVGKLSKGSAFGIVIVISLIWITFRVVNALLSGNPS